jgi:hypothetical protein
MPECPQYAINSGGCIESPPPNDGACTLTLPGCFQRWQHPRASQPNAMLLPLFYCT